ETLTLLGGGLSYGFFASWGAIVLEGGVTQDDTNTANMTFQRLLVPIYLGERASLQVGALHRQTASKRCHASSVVCLTEGHVRTRSEETAGFVGLGVALR